MWKVQRLTSWSFLKSDQHQMICRYEKDRTQNYRLHTVEHLNWSTVHDLGHASKNNRVCDEIGNETN